ncbi:unnamed protein product [Adineta steineri]|uniref:Carbohydrate-binding module family 96 domain-containing protein n=1 Tax=Adineta steineri TaxID=433720 RepID=A0A813YYB1_9BILA|nr:unnamed protein product [Adineta steineri]CAF3888762.1 unnamed protein product [Adineta steineri]
MLLLLVIVSILSIGSLNGDAVIQAAFRACPGSSGSIWTRPSYCPADPSNNPPQQTEIMDLIAWTWNTAPKEQACPFGLSRVLLRFDQMTDVIPQDAIIRSATLKLFGVGSQQVNGYAFSYFGNSALNAYAPAHYGPNRVNITRVTQAYDMATVTWNTQPSSQGPPAVIPESNMQYYYNVAVDVKSLVDNMLAPGTNNGFLLQFEVEDYYRSMNFFSSNTKDESKRPLLEVEYILSCKGSATKDVSLEAQIVNLKN